MASVAVEGYARSSSALGAGRSGASGAPAAAAEFERLEWLEDGKHSLDWNGPTDRIFTRFRDEDLDRQQPRRELTHLRVVSLAEVDGITRSVELMTADERVYRVFFLVSIGLVKELRDSDGRRIYRVPAATGKALRALASK